MLPRDSIFVSIASYCDPLLEFTLLSALSQASWPERLRFGVVDQSREPHRLRHAPEAMRARVRYVQMDPLDARGPCWARAIAMSFHQGEDWFLQIDSHTLFAAGWDETLVHWGRWATARNPRSIVTTYPNPFTMVSGQPVPQTVTDKVLAHVVKTGVDLAEAHPVLTFEAVPVETDEPVPAFHVAAGCFFAPGRITQELPYDPFLYFHGEEQSLALRAWTRGWDLWHVPGMPMWHEYVHVAPVDASDAAGVQAGVECASPFHTTDASDAERSERSSAMDLAAQRRMAALLYGREASCERPVVDNPLGVYGLGTARSLADYAAFSGIDYAHRSINMQARKQRYGYGV
ncbi:hypothetical protein BH11PSE9_BH11PSE9_35500 [soil metagenome]